MSSLARIRASRANGLLTRGPKTPDGKVRSSQNAIRHGLLARSVVMENESAADFDTVRREMFDYFQPQASVEVALVEEMAAAFWKLRRLWAIETAALNNELKNHEHDDEVQRIAASFTSLAAHPSNILLLVHRYETRLHMMYQRALHNLLLLRNWSVAPLPVLNEPDHPGVPNEPRCDP